MTLDYNIMAAQVIVSLTIMMYIQHNTFRTNNINFTNSAINTINVY
jgi:hypothetical protein